MYDNSKFESANEFEFTTNFTPKNVNKLIDNLPVKSVCSTLYTIVGLLGKVGPNKSINNDEVHSAADARSY